MKKHPIEPENWLHWQFHGSSASPKPSQPLLCTSLQLPAFKSSISKLKIKIFLIFFRNQVCKIYDGPACIPSKMFHLIWLLLKSYISIFISITILFVVGSTIIITNNLASLPPSWTNCTFSIVDLLCSVWSNQTPPPHLWKRIERRHWYTNTNTNIQISKFHI